MGVLKLIPATKDYLWGGSRLVRDFGKKAEGAVLAETWELACHKDGSSLVANGDYAGKALSQYIEKEGKKVLGRYTPRTNTPAPTRDRTEKPRSGTLWTAAGTRLFIMESSGI
ncbi:MAG: hypothetical protein RRY54_06115 [Angelakisella sp.]